MNGILRALLLAAMAAPALADAELTLTASHDHTKIALGSGGSAVIRNVSATEAARNVVVEVTASPGLEFHLPFIGGVEWSCTPGRTKFVCTKDRIAPGELTLIGFHLLSTDPAGGYRRVDMAMTAQNAPAKSLAFEVIVPREYAIATAADFGAGSLRAAIEDANAHPFCGTEIACNISISRTVPLIAPETPLPAIRKCNTNLRGADNDEFALQTKPTAISGENASYGNGLEVRIPVCAPGVPNVLISGLAVHSWPWNGIAVEGTAEEGPGTALVVVHRTYIGTDRTGLVARPNRGWGVVVDSPHTAVAVGYGVASTNGRSGIAVLRARQVWVTAMRIEGNGASGIASFGAPLVVGESTIAHNRHFGLAIARGAARAAVSYSAIHSNSGLPVDWGLDGATPADDAETDGVPNTPRILDAYYDAAADQTVIRGVVRMRSGTFGDVYRIDAYVATSRRGDVAFRLSGSPLPRDVPPGLTDVPIEMALPGDQRGRLLALQFHGMRNGGIVASSEISEAVPVR